MKNRILNKLTQIEQEHNIEILFAVESGSRAWGFASPDSDYDIRFVYRRNKDWYLNLWEKKDTIEFMTEDDLDGSGWDLKKALTLLAKSNASFNGWLFSPIVYRSNEKFLSEIRQLANDNFNPVSGFYHFHSMNKGFEDILGSDKMTLKSYFYAIRTALCAKWIAEYASIPPVEFRELYVLIDKKYHKTLDDLIELKSRHAEKSDEPIDQELIDLAHDVVNHNNSVKAKVISRTADKDAFNSFFIKSLQ
jgi:predicted nucleotidyltransferase